MYGKKEKETFNFVTASAKCLTGAQSQPKFVIDNALAFWLQGPFEKTHFTAASWLVSECTLFPSCSTYTHQCLPRRTRLTLVPRRRICCCHVSWPTLLLTHGASSCLALTLRECVVCLGIFLHRYAACVISCLGFHFYASCRLLFIRLSRPTPLI